MPFTVVTTTTAFKEFPYSVLQGHTIYTTLKCENKAGLTSVMSSNGVQISNDKPSTATAEVKLLSIPATENTPRDSYQGVTNNIRLRWTGYTDDIGVETYMV